MGPTACRLPTEGENSTVGARRMGCDGRLGVWASGPRGDRASCAGEPQVIAKRLWMTDPVPGLAAAVVGRVEETENGPNRPIGPKPINR